MKITGFRRKLGTALAILTALSLTFASCSADAGEDSPNPEQEPQTKVEDKEQQKTVVQPAVTGLSATAGDEKVVLSWTNPTNEEFASLVVSYTPSESSSKKTLSKNTTTCTFSSLTNDTEYTFTVTAISTANTTGIATVKATPKAPVTLTKDGITFLLSNDSSYYTVTYVSSNYISGLGTSSDISIPSTVGSDNIPVKEIAAKSVSSLVKSLFIPKSVTKIEEGAFANASALKDIYYEGTETEFSSVTGSDQAKNLENVTMHYESLGANTDSNGWQFFLDGEKYTIIGYSGSATEIVLPSEFKGLPVTKITGGIFKDNSKITSVSIPESIENLGYDTFNGCSNLTSLYYNAKSVSGNYGGFEDTGDLSVTIGKSVEKLPGIFTNWKSSGEMKHNVVSVTFEEGSVCTEIGKWAFQDCEKLTSVNLPASLTTIEQSAFEGTGLTQITIGENVTSIGKAAFANCTSLETINYNANATLPDSYSGIGYDYVFYKATGKVVVGKNVTKIPSKLFYESEITNIEFEEGSLCTEFGDSSFYAKTLKEIEFPENLTTVGSSAVYSTNGGSLKKIYFNAKATSSVSVSAVYVDTLVIGKNLTIVSSNWFGNYKIQPIHVVFEEGSVCTEIGNEAFSGCSLTLKSVDVPASVKTIGNKAFYGCSNLKTVTGLRGVTSVGSDSFNGTAISTLYFANTGFKSIGSGAFTPRSARIYVYLTASKSSVSDSNSAQYYTLNQVTIYYAVIEESVGNAVYSFATVDSTPTVSNPTVTSTPTLIKATIPSGKNADLTQITTSFTRIGEKAFSGNTSVGTIAIPDTVTEIASDSFSGVTFGSAYYLGEPSDLTLSTSSDLYENLWCKPETSGNYVLGIPYSEKKDGEYFIRKYKGTEKLVDIAADLSEFITSGKSVTGIAKGAFENNTALRRIYILSSIKKIKENAFNGCTNLVKAFSSASSSAVTVKEGNSSLSNVMVYGVTYNSSNHSVTNGSGTFLGIFDKDTIWRFDTVDGTQEYTIGEYAFSFSDYLKTITLESNRDIVISKNAIYECSALTTLTIKNTSIAGSDDVTIKDSAVVDCPSLATFTYNDKAKVQYQTSKSASFVNCPKLQ
ncbi:MAG: leucine-rich repeat protein [Treponema sp.]|nr:leucine-rich repeat protein [Treponema sp.]